MAPLSQNVFSFSSLCSILFHYLRRTCDTTCFLHCWERDGFIGPEANVTVARGLTWHTLVQSKQHSADSVWQTGRGRRMTMNHWCRAHKSQPKHTSASQMHAHTHLSPFSYSSVLSHLQRGVFLCAIPDFVVTETDGGIERGMAQQQKRRNLPLPFTLVWNNINSHCWPVFFWLAHFFITSFFSVFISHQNLKRSYISWNECSQWQRVSYSKSKQIKS